MKNTIVLNIDGGCTCEALETVGDGKNEVWIEVYTKEYDNLEFTVNYTVINFEKQNSGEHTIYVLKIPEQYYKANGVFVLGIGKVRNLNFSCKGIETDGNLIARKVSDVDYDLTMKEKEKRNCTIEVGDVITGEPGSAAKVTNVGTETDAIFDFAIPRGNIGSNGADGRQGEEGLSVYVSSQYTAPYTMAIAYDTITVPEDRTLKKGDLILANPDESYLYQIDSLGSGGPNVTYICSLRGIAGQDGARGAAGANGEEGLGIWRSSTSSTTSTGTIYFSSITIPTGRSVKVGDLIIANNTYSYLYRVTSVYSTYASVSYLTSLRGATGPEGADGSDGADAFAPYIKGHKSVQGNGTAWIKVLTMDTSGYFVAIANNGNTNTQDFAVEHAYVRDSDLGLVVKCDQEIAANKTVTIDYIVYKL